MASALELMRRALASLQAVDLSGIEPMKAASLQSARSDMEAAVYKLDNLCAVKTPAPEPKAAAPEPKAAAPEPKAAEPPKNSTPSKQVRFEEPPAPQDPRLKAIAEASREQLCAELELMDWPEWVLYDYFVMPMRPCYSDHYLRAGLSWFVESTGMFPSEVPAEKKHLVNYGAYFRILGKLTPEQFATDFRCAYRNYFTKEELLQKDLDYLCIFAKDWIVMHRRLPFVYKDLLVE